MSYPNAASGVSKIRTGAILTLVATFCSIIAIIFVGAGIGAAANSKSVEGAIGSAVAGLAGLIIFKIAQGVLTLIAFILTLIGVIKAMKDESSFTMALIFTIVGNVCGIIELFLSGTAQGVFQLISSLASIAAIMFIVIGIRNLAQKLGNSDLTARYRTLVIIIAVICVLTLVANIIVLANGGVTGAAVSVAFSIIAAVLNIVLLFIYLSYLGRAKAMLETA